MRGGEAETREEGSEQMSPRLTSDKGVFEARRSHRNTVPSLPLVARSCTTRNSSRGLVRA